MKEKLYALFFAAMVAIIGYIMVSTAAKHTAADEANLRQYMMDTASKRWSR
jgi:hypothetical protein